MPMAEAPYTRTEEIAHCLTHVAGIAGCLVAIPWLALTAAAEGDAWRLVGGLIFAACALLMFSTSVAYHAASAPQVKTRLRTLDHAAIYLLIAGTYTPITIGVMRDGWGWSIFGVLWGLALLGIVAKTTLGFRFHLTSTMLYVAMGWIGMLAAKPIFGSLTGHELAWVIAGGLVYTAGVPFYLWKRQRYSHAAWHLFVLGGVACHFVAVLSMMTAEKS
jgi:hemolysin III